MLAKRPLQAEPPDQRLQLPPQPRQLHARRRSLLARRGRLIGNISHRHHIAVDLLGHRALLFTGRGDLLVHALDARHCLGDLPQRRARPPAQFDAVAAQVAAAVEQVHHLRRTTVQVADKLLDLLGGLLGTLGQAAHFMISGPIWKTTEIANSAAMTRVMTQKGVTLKRIVKIVTFSFVGRKA